MKKLFSFLFFSVPFLSYSQEKGLDKRIDEAFAPISNFFSDIVFFEMNEVSLYADYTVEN